MNFTTAEAHLRAHFETEWDDATPILWPDVRAAIPNETWVRFSMKNNEGAQKTIGASTNRFVRDGVVIIQIFQKENQGSTDARAKADLAADIFLANGLDGFRFSRVNAQDIGADGKGWYQWNVTAEYEYDRYL